VEPWFLVTERFDARCGARWRDYVAWAQLPQVVEIVTTDEMLCPHVVGDLQPDGWAHNVAEDHLLHFFRDVDHLVRRCGGIDGRNLLCVFREPERHPDPPPGRHAFRSEGYDLADQDGSTSALTNCGGFPRAFAPSALNERGLLPSLEQARAVQRALAREYPDQPHPRCWVWAVFRASAGTA
jgi:hypothetical protein